MKFPLLAIPCLALFMTAAATAQAETFTFDAEGGGFSSSGTLTAVADPNLPNVFDITGISGYVNGRPILGLLPCAAYDPSNPCGGGSSGFLFYDNLLYPAGSPNPLFPDVIRQVDYSGIGFDLGDGVEGVFAATNKHQEIFITNRPHDNGVIIRFALTPEPSSFFLLGTGLLAVAGTIRHRVRSSSRTQLPRNKMG